MQLNPVHLAQLSVIVEAGSFQSAADRLGMTQPGLSRNMKALEARLGAPLFKKEGRRSIPTNLGRRLARNGLTIRLAEEQANAYAQQSAVGGVGELRLGVVPIVAGRFLTPILAEFSTENPECSIELRVGLVHELRAMLERDQIDLVLGPSSLAHGVPALQCEELTDDRIGILCRSEHFLTRAGHLSVDALKGATWLMHSRGSLLRQQTEAALQAMGVNSIRIGFETDSVTSVFEILAATDMISTMPTVTAAPYLGDSLVFLPMDTPLFSRPLGAIRLAAHRRTSWSTASCGG